MFLVPIPWFFNVVQGFCMIMNYIWFNHTWSHFIWHCIWHVLPHVHPSLTPPGAAGTETGDLLGLWHQQPGQCWPGSFLDPASLLQKEMSTGTVQCTSNIWYSMGIWGTMNVKYHLMYMVHLISSNVYWCYGNYESMYNSMTVNMTCTCMVLICTNTNMNMK